MNIVQLRKRGGCGQHGGDVERSDYENLPGYGVRTGPVRPGHAFGRKGVPCGARVALQLLSLEGCPGHRDHRERLAGYFPHGAVLRTEALPRICPLDLRQRPAGDQGVSPFFHGAFHQRRQLRQGTGAQNHGAVFFPHEGGNGAVAPGGPGLSLIHI